ncbi:MAG TPA: hypothetical protein VFN21_11725 [Acidimicrobiales bacterium]|nr:hypothetical protein [Acidimicrobiales bacterium]
MNGIEEAGSLDIGLGDAGTVRLKPPELWSQQAHDLIAAGKNRTDPEAVGRAILGDEEWDRFVAAGGTYPVLDKLIGDRHELTAPESSAS